MPTITAETYAVSAGHELATAAGMSVLKDGGNAVDAACAAGIALGVLHSDLVSFAGVAPMMIRMADTGKVVTIDGLGVWPKAASAAFFEKEFDGAMPQGILRTVVPAAPDAWITALSDFGTMTFNDVAHFARDYARDGFPMYQLFSDFVATHQAAYARYPSNAAIYLPDGRPPVAGQTFVQSDLGHVIQYMMDEEKAAGGDRRHGLRAARDAFYKGDVADIICDFHAAHGGFMTRDDMANFAVRYEAPIEIPFGNDQLFACGAWCQGVSLAQAFRMVDGLDIKALGHNSAAYIHTLTEALKLVFADREAYVADPAFVDVPIDDLLNEDYLAMRRNLIDPSRAFADMPPAGDPAQCRATADASSIIPGIEAATDVGDAHAFTDPASADTSYVAVIDGHGNMVSATPSDPSADTEVIPGTGLAVSSRGSQSRGISASINGVEPGKRPRLTPNPALAVRDGKPMMAFGSPGGDVQIQAMMQVYLNATLFGMDIQTAIEAPRFATYSFPSSFAPNDHFPGLLMVEESLEAGVGDDLRALGHDAKPWTERTWKAGGVLAVMQDDTGTLHAGADPRRAGKADGR